MTKSISLAALAAAIIAVAATAPANAEDALVASRTVQFRQVSFTCGEANQSGKVVRLMRATPALKYLPEYEPTNTDPLAKSWGIIYRNICERDANMTASLSDKQR